MSIAFCSAILWVLQVHRCFSPLREETVNRQLGLVTPHLPNRANNRDGAAGVPTPLGAAWPSGPEPASCSHQPPGQTPRSWIEVGTNPAASKRASEQAPALTRPSTEGVPRTEKYTHALECSAWWTRRPSLANSADASLVCRGVWPHNDTLIYWKCR